MCLSTVRLRLMNEPSQTIVLLVPLVGPTAPAPAAPQTSNVDLAFGSRAGGSTRPQSVPLR